MQAALPGDVSQDAPGQSQPASPDVLVDVLPAADAALSANTGGPAVDLEDEAAAPAKRKEPLLPNPPVVPNEVLEAAKKAKKQMAKDGQVDTDLDAQRDLKRRLKQEEEDKKNDAKQAATMKQQSAAQKALEKAQKQLEKAQAKAVAVQNKMDKQKGVKRNLDSAFASVDNKGGSAGSPNKRTRTRKGDGRKKEEKTEPTVKLSPKARAFAAGVSPVPKPKAKALPKASPAATRAAKARLAMQRLRDLAPPDLKLPEGDFTKKSPVCKPSSDL